jgi:hypothetical protein
MSKHTLADKVLCAALVLDARGIPRFTSADLAVQAWKADFDAFGLDGYEESHCDCNAVNVTIMGKRGLPARGFLQKAGRYYSLTTAGRKRALMLTGADKPPPAPVREYVLLTMVEVKELNELFDTAAWGQRHEREGISIHGARRFWGGHPSGMRILLEGIAERLATAPAVLPGGREVTAADVAELLDLHRWLVGRFVKEKAHA